MASYVQDDASVMREPPKAATDCPHEDIARLLHQLEDMTNIPFCRHCYAMGNNCRCQRATPQASTPLWNPPGYSYVAMTAVTTTTASTSMGGVPSVADPAPDFPALSTPMDTLPAPSTTNLLIQAGVGRGGAIQAMQAAARYQAQLCQVHIRYGLNWPSSSRPPQ